MLVEYAALDVVVLHAMKGAWMKYSPLNLNNLESDRWAPAREGRRRHDAGLMPAQGRQMALQDGVARLVMRDLADAILANMPVGYRLLIQRVGPGFPAIFEAKTVAAGDRIVYLARHPHGASNCHAAVTLGKPTTHTFRQSPSGRRGWRPAHRRSSTYCARCCKTSLITCSFSSCPHRPRPTIGCTPRTRCADQGLWRLLYAVGGSDGTNFYERALDEAIAALGILRGPVSGPLSCGKSSV